MFKRSSPGGGIGRTSDNRRLVELIGMRHRGRSLLSTIDRLLLVVQQIIAQVGAVVEQKAPRQPRFIQPLQNAEIMDGHAYVSLIYVS